MSTNFQKILNELNLKLARQEQNLEATKQHIEAIKALEKIEAKTPR